MFSPLSWPQLSTRHKTNHYSLTHPHRDVGPNAGRHQFAVCASEKVMISIGGPPIVPGAMLTTKFGHSMTIQVPCVYPSRIQNRLSHLQTAKVHVHFVPGDNNNPGAGPEGVV